MSGRAENGTEEAISTMASHPKAIVDWWVEDLTIFRIDIFQQGLIPMMARGFKQYVLGPIFMLNAQRSLRGNIVEGRKKIEPQQEHEKWVVLETIVSFLPREKNALSASILPMLLRSAVYLETTVACRLDLEKRMALQLGHAILDNLLIPVYSFTGDTLFDVDSSTDRVSPTISDMEWVGKLMENYLAEIASDCNLSVAKFISLAGTYSRAIKGYRGWDIYREP